jgi:hypothetical protein
MGTERDREKRVVDFFRRRKKDVVMTRPAEKRGAWKRKTLCGVNFIT